MKALSESFRLSPLKSSTSNALSNNNFLKSRDEVVRFLLELQKILGPQIYYGCLVTDNNFNQ